MEPPSESVTLSITTNTYFRMQEPAYPSSTSIEVCAAAQIGQPLRRLVAFEYYRTIRTTANHLSYNLPRDRPFSIIPGSTNFNSCFNIRITGDDNIDLTEEQLVIAIEPVSPLDRVTANNITIVLEDNPSFLPERLLPFGEVYGDEVIQYAADIRFSQPQLASNISDLRFQYYGVEEDAIYVGQNGLLSFRAPSGSIVPPYVPVPLSENPPLLTNHTLVAPFWQTTNFGTVGRILYRYSDNRTILDIVGSYVAAAFDSEFSPGLLFITTWDRVIYSSRNRVNTFQAVIATDGTKTFVLFLYGDIQRYSNYRTTMGFSAGDRTRSFTIAESRFNNRLYNLERSSNVGRSSVFIFRVDQHYIALSPRTNLTVSLNLSMTSTEMNITEPDHGDLPTDVRICPSAQLDQSIERLASFEYYVADFSTAISNDYSISGRPSLYIPPGSTRYYRGCITARIFGDDRPENDETVTFLFEPLSTLDRVNFGPNVTINIIDNDQFVEGVDYLEFIDLDVFDGNINTVDVLPDSIEQRNNANYLSAPIGVRAGIPIGARDQLTNFIFVMSDGAITFDRPYKSSTPLTFPLDSLQIVAPFLIDHATVPGTVRYRVYTAVTNQVIRRVSSFVRNRGFPGDFVGHWMLVAEWRNLRGVFTSRTNTYQAIIISDGDETFAVFTYNCNQLNWAGNFYGYAAVGYNVFVTGNNALLNHSNHPLSRIPPVGTIACTNQLRYGSPWSNLVYRIGVSTSNYQMQRSSCMANVSRDEERYPILSSSLNDQFFLSSQVFARESLFVSNSIFFRVGIQDCPCTRMQAERDNRFGIARRQSFLGDKICFFSRLSALYAGVSFGLRCCYTTRVTANGRIESSIVTADPLGRGSILVLTSIGATSSGSEYVENTLAFEDECCSVGLCDMFYSRRVPRTCSSYSFITFTWGLGDPHISTLDGANYTFNGWGEYTLTQLGDFVFQGRTTPANASAPGSATQFSAFAFGIPNATVEVQLYNGDLRLLLNSEDITNTIPAANDTNTNSSLVYLQRNSEDSILSLFSYGISITVTRSFDILSFVASIPQEYQGLTSGLLGNFNGESSDDLMYANGTVVELNSPYNVIHEFGQSWLIDPADGLFTYPPGMSAGDFSFPDHTPLSVDEVVAGASQEVQDTCQGNVKCIFDATQTGNMDVGLNTMQMEDVFMEDQIIASNNPPNITGPPSFVVTLNQESSFTITVVDNNLDSFSIDSGDVNDGVLSRDNTDSSLYTFTWTPNATIQDPIVFIATDDLGASSQYQPQIAFCQCLNGGQCTLQGVLDQMANPVDLTCLCAPGYEGRYCGDDVDGCRDFACLEGVECIDNPAPAEGATCGPCPPGFSQFSGRTCSVTMPTAPPETTVPTEPATTTEAATTTEDATTAEVTTMDTVTTADATTTTDDMDLVATTNVRTLDPSRLPAVVEENLVGVTLYGNKFTEDQQRLYEEVTLQVVNTYCVASPDQCIGVGVTGGMRQISNILDTGVFLVNIRRNERNSVNFEMYIASSPGSNLMVLSQHAFYKAVQMNSDSFIRAGFQATFYVQSTQSDHSSTPFFAGIAAVTVAIVLITILTILVVFCCWWKERRDEKAARPSDVYCNDDAGKEDEVNSNVGREKDTSV